MLLTRHSETLMVSWYGIIVYENEASWYAGVEIMPRYLIPVSFDTLAIFVWSSDLGVPTMII